MVDDAIAVLENIVRRRSEGMGARAAAVLGTREVVFAVLATTTTLAAVFVPLSFLAQTGGLFREFGLYAGDFGAAVIGHGADAVPGAGSAVSGRSCGRRGAMAAVGDGLARVYARTLHACLAAPLVSATVAALVALLAVMLFPTLRQELTPREDRAMVMLTVNAPQGVALDYTDARMREIEDILQPLRAAGEVTNLFSISGGAGRPMAASWW